MIKIRKKYKELKLLMKKKQSIKVLMKIHAHFFLIQKKLHFIKKITKNVIFYTTTILLLVIYSTDK